VRLPFLRLRLASAEQREQEQNGQKRVSEFRVRTRHPNALELRGRGTLRAHGAFGRVIEALGTLSKPVVNEHEALLTRPAVGYRRCLGLTGAIRYNNSHTSEAVWPI